MTRPILAAALAALTLAAPAHAADMSAAEREAFRAEVRAYLLDNPEVLMEAIAVLEQRQAGQQASNDATLIKVNAEDIFRDGHSWVGGNPEGDITLVEFTDYRCGYCRKAHEEVATLIRSDGNIRFIVKEFPILGEESELSSRFAIATKLIAGDEAYKQTHDALITFRGKVTPANLEKLAGRLGLDAGAVLARMSSEEVDQVIQANRALASRLQISGTPTFVLKDQMLRGYVPLAGMREIVSDLRAN
ncbi:DSBA oxidoreductase [Rhodovulum sp. NI22]|uniref:Protein-disulfide isomerase n=1 Tax=Actibacterium naphthalenivorans TaxID=1614693 RepID=A0A840CKE7_9RHOB|nr:MULTISPECIES: DsbA family protein [Actibacterium]ALG90612.1 DSBA oxidoreductase [Actibacterium sp. EMB200-NS6]KGB81992.1 DSBA oxidoreductase [Rhodovulum sp. NI22]MBB4023216.1 protein-disulfide isomerase [Actibacterium naphthalenivorans]